MRQYNLLLMIFNIFSGFFQNATHNENQAIICPGEVVEDQKAESGQSVSISFGKKEHKIFFDIHSQISLLSPNYISLTPIRIVPKSIFEKFQNNTSTFQEIVQHDLVNIDSEDAFTKICTNFQCTKYPKAFSLDKESFIRAVICNRLGRKKIRNVLLLLEAAQTKISLLSKGTSVELSGDPLYLPYNILIKREENKATCSISLSPVTPPSTPFSSVEIPVLPSIEELAYISFSSSEENFAWKPVERAIHQFGIKNFQTTISTITKPSTFHIVQLYSKNDYGFITQQIGNLKFCVLEGKADCLVMPYNNAFHITVEGQKRISRVFSLVTKKPYISLISHGKNSSSQDQNRQLMVLEASLTSYMLRKEKTIKTAIQPYLHIAPLDDRVEAVSKPLSMDLLAYMNKPKVCSFLGDHSPKTVSIKLKIASSLAKSLLSIHSTGIVHRDIKPENILVDTHDTFPSISSLRYCDFGFSWPHGLTVKPCGSPIYIAPECILAEVQQNYSDFKADYKQDVWSLGQVLFTLFTGTQAFSQEILIPIFSCVAKKKKEEALQKYDSILHSFKYTLSSFLQEHYEYGNFLCGMLEADPEERSHLEHVIHEIESTQNRLAPLLYE